MVVAVVVAAAIVVSVLSSSARRACVLQSQLMYCLMHTLLIMFPNVYGCFYTFHIQ